MDLTNCADCAPSHMTVAVLVLCALIALIAARRARWTVLLTVPLLLVALFLFGGQDYAHRPAVGLTITVLGLPLVGVLPWSRMVGRRSKLNGQGHR